jgi:hypothetical protein
MVWAYTFDDCQRAAGAGGEGYGVGELVGAGAGALKDYGGVLAGGQVPGGGLVEQAHDEVVLGAAVLGVRVPVEGVPDAVFVQY